MPLNKIIQSLSGTCRHCGQQTGLLQRTHPQCRQTHQTGWQEMVQLSAKAAGAHTFNEAALRQTLGASPALPSNRGGDRTGLGGGLPAGSHPGNERRHPHPPGGGTTALLPG